MLLARVDRAVGPRPPARPERRHPRLAAPSRCSTPSPTGGTRCGPAGSARSGWRRCSSSPSLPHALAWSYGTAAQAMFGQIFGGSAVRSISSAPPPADGQRLNVLLIGVDSGARPDRGADRLDDRRLPRSGRADRVDGLDPARPRQRPARQRRRLRAEDQLADELGRAPPGRLPATAAIRTLEDASGRCSGSRSTPTRRSTSADSSRWSTRSAGSTST